MRLDDTARIGNATPIAIIGMACRLPGVDSPQLLWEALLGRRFRHRNPREPLGCRGVITTPSLVCRRSVSRWGSSMMSAVSTATSA